MQQFIQIIFRDFHLWPIFPEFAKARFCNSDSGVGIRDNVRNYTGKIEMSSSDAIEWALTEGNTTKGQPGGLV